MKIYRVQVVTNGDHGTVLGWAGSKADAKGVARQIIEDHKCPDADAEITQVDFPNSKQGVLDWLNRYFWTDNG